jgi:hypothetical protein
VWIKRRDTARRYGVSVRTIERWEADPELNFPKSRIVNGRRYDNAEALKKWDLLCAAAGRTTRTPPAAGKPAKREPDDREAKAGASAA